MRRNLLYASPPLPLRGTRRRGDRDWVDTGDVLDMLGRLRDAASEDLRDDPWGGPGAGPRPV